MKGRKLQFTIFLFFLLKNEEINHTQLLSKYKLLKHNARITGCREGRDFCGSFAKTVTLTAVLVHAIVRFILTVHIFSHLVDKFRELVFD